MKRTLFLSFASRKRSFWIHADLPGGRRRRTHYQVLGVDAEAEPYLIEAAYRAIMRRAHPDMGGDTARAQMINEAFRVLRDPVSRASYDLTLSVALSARPPTQHESPPSRVRATASRQGGLVSNAYLMLGVVLVAAALLAARESVAGAREVSAAALNPQPFWRTPTVALRKIRS